SRHPRQSPTRATRRPVYPRGDASTQRARDEERRQILERELRKEEERLAALEAEYKGGEPDRLGSERNYQKYLDRVERLKSEIERAEGNVASIRREIDALPRRRPAGSGAALRGARPSRERGRAAGRPGPRRSHEPRGRTTVPDLVATACRREILVDLRRRIGDRLAPRGGELEPVRRDSHRNGAGAPRPCAA